MPHFINIVQLDLDVFNNIEKYVKNIDKKTIENFFDITDCHFGIKTEIMKYILWIFFLKRKFLKEVFLMEKL